MVMGWMEGERCMHAQGEEERESICARAQTGGCLLRVRVKESAKRERTQS